MDAERDLALGLEARHVGGDEIAAAGAGGVRQREEAGEDRRRGMTAYRVVAIVVVERVGSRAIDERRVKRRHAPLAAEHEARARPGAEHVLDDARQLLARPGERHAHRVEYANLGPMHGLGRQVFVADGVDTFRELLSKCHWISWQRSVISRHSAFRPICFTSLLYLAISERI